MVESRWFRRAGPAVAALGAIAFIASTTLGAPDRTWVPAACAGAARVGDPAPGTWYRIDPTLQGGARTGQRLVIGLAPDEVTRTLALDAESFAAGPFGGTILVGTDDGTRTRLSLIDVARACAWLLDESADVVRTATIGPDRATVSETRVDRRTREDLGVWRRALDGSTPPARVLPPIAADDRFGRTWLTDLVWSDDGASLAVQSCGEIACRVRISDMEGGDVRLVADPAMGDVVGLAEGRLIAHGACRGLPCPLLSLDLASGATVTLDELAGQAVLSRDAEGRPVVVHEVGTGGGTLRVVKMDGRDPQLLQGGRDGRLLIPGQARAGSAAEHPSGWILFGPDGRLPIDGSVQPVLRHVPDGRAVPLDEVSR